MFRFWQRFLLVSAAVASLAGLLIALLAGTAALAPLDGAVLATFFPSLELTEAESDFHRFAFGVMGGVMAGWGLLIALIAAFPFARKERWSFWALALSLDCWFLIDTTASALYGVWANVLGNVIFLVLFSLPLLATASHFLGRAPASLAALPGEGAVSG